MTTIKPNGHGEALHHPFNPHRLNKARGALEGMPWALEGVSMMLLTCTEKDPLERLSQSDLANLASALELMADGIRHRVNELEEALGDERRERVRVAE